MAYRKVEFFAVDPHTNAYPVDAIQYLGEVLRIAVFPPTHAGFVGVINTGYIAAL